MPQPEKNLINCKKQLFDYQTYNFLNSLKIYNELNFPCYYHALLQIK